MLLVNMEGIDGSGKSTILEEVARHFDNIGLPHVVTKEPKGIFRDIILDPDNRYGLNEMARMFLYQADRAVHSEFIKEQDKTDNVVLCDRGLMSTLVYQAITTKTDIADLMNISLMACQRRVPDVIFLLHASTEIAKQRMNKRNEKKNYFDLKGDSFFKDIQKQYEKVSRFLERYHNVNVVTINTDEMSIDEVTYDISNQITNLLTLKKKQCIVKGD